MSAIPVADDVLDADIEVLSLAEVATRLELSVNKVRQLLRDGHLVAVRRDGDLFVPACFLTEDGLVKGLVGTLTVLADAGFDSSETLRWLFTADDSLPGTPIEALRTNRGTEVKRRAQASAI
ncbi:MAG: DNA-binding protein [Pseudonocardiaceae bacterium]|nr:DNA-binding protein [Pseudonocardiaceae bacterium]